MVEDTQLLAIWLKITTDYCIRNMSKCHCVQELVSVSYGHSCAVKQTTVSSGQVFPSHSLFCGLDGALLLEAVGLKSCWVTLPCASLIFLGPVTKACCSRGEGRSTEGKPDHRSTVQASTRVSSLHILLAKKYHMANSTVKRWGSTLRPSSGQSHMTSLSIDEVKRERMNIY